MCMCCHFKCKLITKQGIFDRVEEADICHIGEALLWKHFIYNHVNILALQYNTSVKSLTQDYTTAGKL